MLGKPIHHSKLCCELRADELLTAENGCLCIKARALGGQDHGEAVSLAVKAGTLVAMDDRLLHCSHSNISNRVRRAWMPQFSQKPILCKQLQPFALAVPIDGQPHLL